MNIGHRPELLDRLAASYALGSLKGGARRRLEAYARQSATVRASMLLWQERMAAMTELSAPIQPSPNVWKRIQIALAQELEAGSFARAVHAREGLMQTTMLAISRKLSWWRAGALAGGLATVAALMVTVNTARQADTEISQLNAKLQSASQVQYVAVLSDDKSAASVLVTFDAAKNSLTLKRVGGYQEAADKSLQLWALPPQGGPQSLGVLASDKVMRIAAPASQVVTIPMLAISLEPKGGVPSATGPTGPVLFKGALLETVL
jgi:anti-sigma-K factor RskA